MARTWGVPVYIILILVTLSSAQADEEAEDLPFNFDQQHSDNIMTEASPDREPRLFRDGDYGGPKAPAFQSKWANVKQDIQNVLSKLPEGDLIQDGGEDPDLSSALEDHMNRGQALRNLYNRLLAAKEKRSLYGSILRGYKLGKREFMPYELMNEYQKRLFGSVLNNYKFGKRVPEELPANYLTGGQIYDNISDDPRERKRMFGSVLKGSFKMGRRTPSLDYYRRAVRNPLLLVPSYRNPYKDS